MSALIRLAPLQPGELPAHPLLNQGNPEHERPDLLPFLLAILDQGNAFLHKQSFGARFKPHSKKPSPPSNAEVETLTYTATETELDQINWSDTGIGGFSRVKPRGLKAENWFARRSYHQNVSVAQNSSTASWDEFVFGLRDDHSKHEQDFTPTLYDAHHILDWNEEIQAAAKSWRLEARAAENPGKYPYTNITLSVYEMCHEVPWPLSPRCFPVLVATASTSPKRFVAVTIPVNLGSVKEAFYSNGRHKSEGSTALQRKDVVIGGYTAVEQCELFEKEVDGKPGKVEGTIEWLMATASDAKGNVPMAVQKPSMPGAVAKDVGLFLKWMKDVKRGIPSEQSDGQRTGSMNQAR